MPEIDIIINGLYKNASIFLNDAIVHLNKSADSYSDKLLAVIDIQIALELAIKVRIAQDYGITAILEQIDSETSIDELIQKYTSNALRAKEFEATKNFLKSQKTYNQIFTDEYVYMDRFQRYRNKLIHFNYNFSEAELIAIESDIIHIIVYIIHSLLSSDLSAEEYREFIFEIIKSSEYSKLLRNPKFYNELKNLIVREYNESYYCPLCDRKLLTPIKKCLGCLVDFGDEIAFGFVKCQYCGKETVVFDALNLPDNKMLRGLCVNCGEDTFVYRCEVCGKVYNWERFDATECRPGYCATFDESVQ